MIEFPMLLAKMDSEIMGVLFFSIFIVGAVGGILVTIVKTVSSHLRRSRLDEMEATLKLEMIERGMSADEISQVLAARMGGPKAAESLARTWDAVRTK